jgi:tRNA uridine 5-carboxymethylaminomethyl modification enzyme
LTSRAEYRLVLRQDNADLRLTDKGRAIGLVNEERWKRFQDKKENYQYIKEMWKATVFSPLSEDLYSVMAEAKSTPVRGGISARDLIRRPEITLEHLVKLLPELVKFDFEVLEEVEIETKYAGYIEKQWADIENSSKLEARCLSETLDYEKVRGLSTEGRQRLMEVRPLNIGQASRITGVTPADISVLLVSLEQRRRRGNR